MSVGSEDEVLTMSEESSSSFKPKRRRYSSPTPLRKEKREKKKNHFSCARRSLAPPDPVSWPAFRAAQSENLPRRLFTPPNRGGHPRTSQPRELWPPPHPVTLSLSCCARARSLQHSD